MGFDTKKLLDRMFKKGNCISLMPTGWTFESEKGNYVHR